MLAWVAFSCWGSGFPDASRALNYLCIFGPFFFSSGTNANYFCAKIQVTTVPSRCSPIELRGMRSCNLDRYFHRPYMILLMHRVLSNQLDRPASVVAAQLDVSIIWFPQNNAAFDMPNFNAGEFVRVVSRNPFLPPRRSWGTRR